MRKYLMVVLIMAVAFLSIFAQKEVVLPEITNPKAIVIDNQRIYIIQEVNVFIYSLKDFKLLNKFGQAGEGPREFKKVPQPWVPSITLYLAGEELLINSVGKISMYSKDGKFLNEKSVAGFGLFTRFIPLQKNFILMEMLRENEMTVVAVNMLDQDLTREKKKRLCTVPFPQQTGKKRNPILMAKMATYLDRYAYEDYLIIPVNEKGQFNIFDGNGKQLGTFTPDYTKVEIDDQRKKKLDEFFCNDVRYKQPYLIDKGRNLITFGDHLPLFNYYRLADDKIYIISNYQQEGNYESFIYNLQGKLLKKTYIRLVNQDIFDVYPFTVKNNKIYQLIWDEEEEEIRLQITDLQI